jgi:hypothetical protein
MLGKICESCGMPMLKKEEFGGGLMDNSYCIHCTDEAGTLLPYDIKLEKMKEFIMSRMGIVEEVAKDMAMENMAKMPAWKNRV